MSATVIIILVISMVLLFVSMVLSAVSNSDIKKQNLQSASKYSLWSAVVSGLSIALLVIVLFLYVYGGKAAGFASQQLGKFAS